MRRLHKKKRNSAGFFYAASFSCPGSPGSSPDPVPVPPGGMKSSHLAPGIFPFDEHRALLVYNTPVSDPENEDTVRKDGIEYSPVPDTIFIQSFELTCQ